jgi:molecular chaperone GrpE
MEQHSHNHKHDKPEHEHPHAHGNHDHGKHPAEEAKKHDDKAKVKQAQPQADTAQDEKKQPAAEQKENIENQKYKETIEQLKSQVDAANDKYLRLMAEFDNYKRRTLKENQQIVEQANEKLIKDIIDVRENFERAFKAHKEGADHKPFMDGMKMIFTKLDNVLHRHGLEVYCEAGQEFDPQLHDAMMKTAHDKIPEHHISEVVEKGYRLKGKVIKHSKVIVSSGKQTPAPAEKEKTGEAEGPEAETVFEVAVEPKEQKKTDGPAGA